jgi:hypothetical protein
LDKDIWTPPFWEQYIVLEREGAVAC